MSDLTKLAFGQSRPGMWKPDF